MLAKEFGHMNVVKQLLDWQKTQIRNGFKLAYLQGFMYVPQDLIELVIEFAV